MTAAPLILATAADPLDRVVSRRSLTGRSNPMPLRQEVRNRAMPRAAILLGAILGFPLSLALAVPRVTDVHVQSALTLAQAVPDIGAAAAQQRKQEQDRIDQLMEQKRIEAKQSGDRQTQRRIEAMQAERRQDQINAGRIQDEKNADQKHQDEIIATKRAETIQQEKRDEAKAAEAAAQRKRDDARREQAAIERRRQDEIDYRKRQEQAIITR